MSASAFKRGSWCPCPWISWVSLSPRLLFSIWRMTGSGRWLFMKNNGLKTTWNGFTFTQTPEVRCAVQLVHRQTKASQITHHSLLHVRVGFNGEKCTPHIQQSTTGTRHLAEITSCYSQHHYLHHIHSHLWISTSPLSIIARLGEKKAACVM